MAATSLPVARLLQLRVPIAWQEAVALVSAADVRSAAEGIPITLEHCHITTAGEVHFSGNLPGLGSEAISSLKLLQALLGGPTAPLELRALAVTADDPLACFPSERDGGTGPRVDLRWCIGANPRADIARLAARGLAAELGAGVAPEPERPGADAPVPALVRARSRERIEHLGPRRRPAVTVRVQRLSRGVALALAAILLAVASGAAAMGVFVGGVRWPLAESALGVPSRGSALPVAGTRTRAGSRATEPEPIAAEPRSAPIPFAEGPAESSPSETRAAEPEGAGPISVAERRTYSVLDNDVEPPAALRPQLPSGRKADGQPGASHLELLIDEQGHVQRVRLDSAEPSVNERMLLSAAKAWQFRPAARAGHPVPYILRVPVTP